MTALQTDFRLALAAAVQAAIDIRIKAGYFTGPVRDGSLGCCYPIGKREDGNVAREIMQARVDVYLRYDQQPDPEVPLDPTPLEQIVETVQVTLSAADQAIGGTWFARLVESEISMEVNGVAMLFEAVSWNKWSVVAPV